MLMTLADALGRAREMVRHSDYVSARKIYADILRAVPGHPAALLGAGDAALASGDFGAAKGYFRTALDGERDALAPLAGLAQALAGLCLHDEARTLSDRALALAPREVIAYATAAWVAWRRGDLAAAEVHSTAGLAIQPSDVTLLRLLGAILESRGARVAALHTFDKAIAANPDDVFSRLGSSTMLLDFGRAEAARAVLEPILNQGHAYPRIFFNLGLAGLMREDFAYADAMFARALESKPCDTLALANLVFTRRHLCAWDNLALLSQARCCRGPASGVECDVDA